MASILILEDGTSVSNSNTYIDVDYADEYFTLYNNQDWSGSDEEKEFALVQGCKSIELLYGPRYLSQILKNNQSLLYPRYSFYCNHKNLYVSGSIPTPLKNAQCEAALLALTGVELYPEPNILNNVKRQKDKVGELETESEYFKPQENSKYENYKKVELQLYPILYKQTSSMNFSR